MVPYYAEFAVLCDVIKGSDFSPSQALVLPSENQPPKHVEDSAKHQFFIENPVVCVTGCKQRAKFALSMECMWIFDHIKPPSLHSG